MGFPGSTQGEKPEDYRYTLNSAPKDQNPVGKNQEKIPLTTASL